MEETFRMEWKIFSMEWKKISCMEYGKIIFHSRPCLRQNGANQRVCSLSDIYFLYKKTFIRPRGSLLLKV